MRRSPATFPLRLTGQPPAAAKGFGERVTLIPMTLRKPRSAVPRPHVLVTATLALAVAAVATAGPAAAQDDEPGPRVRAAISVIERELGSGRYARAQRQVSQALDDLVDAGPASPEPDTLGRLLLYDALAAAGRNLPETTAWTWSLARSVDPSLTAENLLRWRLAGDRLASLPLRPLGDDGDVVGGDEVGSDALNLFAPPADTPVALPRAVRRQEPRFPRSLRGSGTWGAVILQVVVDRRGRPRDPLVRESPHPLLSYAAAEAVQTWRFEPATVDGRRVDVIYEIRFDLRPE